MPETAVHIFYSSTAQPGILDMYQDAITYLREEDTRLEVVDVAETPEAAREFDIVSTPAVVVEHDGETDRFTGVITGLAAVLQDDIYGRSVLYETGFRAGRERAREHDLSGATDADRVEAVLVDMFDLQGADAKLVSFDPDALRAEVELHPRDDAGDPQQRQVVHEQLEAFLGGIFTEVFGESVGSEETQCVKHGADHCAFSIGPDGDTGAG